MDKSKEPDAEKTVEKKKEPSPGTSDKQTGSSKKSKRQKTVVAPIEPRTPLKRQRAPVERFQSPAEELPTPKPKTPHHDDVEVVYKKGVFLAVRGDEETFYLCRTQQNVFSNTKKFKIQWLDMDEVTKHYKFDFLDSTDIECVLTNIKMDRVARETYTLPDSEKKRIEMILTKAIRKEKGMPIDDIDIVPENEVEEEEDEEETEDDEDWEDEPTTKKQKLSKSKTTPPSKKGVRVFLKSGKSSSKKSTPKTKSDKKEKKDTKKTPKKDGKKEGKSDKKRGPDKNLKPNLKIKVIEKDPLFETKDHVPFISKMSHTKLVFRAVLQNDMELLKQLLEDDQHIYNVQIPKSIADERSPFQMAIENNNIEMMTLLNKDITDKGNKRLKQSPPPVLLEALGTGSYNPVSLGVTFIRKLTASRGSREGNAAFTKEKYINNLEVLDQAMLKGVKKETIDAYINTLPINQQGRVKNSLRNSLELAVMRGHLELAGAIIKENKDGHGYNFLHIDVLTKTTEDLPATIRADSVRKKPGDQSMMTPLHCACINPNKKYLERLLSIEPDINLEDKKGRKPIHYAATCQGTGPLEVLLKKGASPFDVTRRKCTPLFYACTARRAENADVLLKRAKTDKGGAGDVFTEKFGVGGINRPNWESICPIHVAAEGGDVELLKILLKHGVDVNKPLSASKNKLSPLMIAASKGNLEMVRLLVQNGAVIEQLDKYKRTALTHAVMNGSVTVASYLLYLGSDPNHADSSGNTLVHYAAAYGWYFVLKLLVNEGGADPKIANDWKLTPVGVAFMKGHMGLVDFLLKMPGVDINFKNDTGMTLLSIACSSALQKGLEDQVVYLLKKGGDPTITDVNGFNALHHLAANKVSGGHGSKEEVQKMVNDKMDLTVKIAQLLIEAGCQPTHKTDNRQTAITLAIVQANIRLITYLVEKGGAISAEKNQQGDNPLHLLAKMCMKNDMATLVKTLNTENVPVEIKENGLTEKMEVDGDNDKALDLRAPENNVPKPSLKKEMSKARPEYMKLMASDVNHNGFTPLLVACEQYAIFKKDKTDNEEFQAALKNGRDFIKAVLNLSGANPSQTVQKKYFEGLEPENESQKYASNGKCSAVHFMVKACSDNKEEGCSGLNLILSYKPDLEVKNLSGDTPLSLAVKVNSLCSVEILLQAKANPNVTYIVEKGAEDKIVEAPVLHSATKSKSVEIVDRLLAAGAQADGRNSKTKRTCLHLAVSDRGDEVKGVQIMSSLLNSGADVNAVDSEKRSALHLSVNSNSGSSDSSTDYEEVLIKKGANIFQKCSSNRMPIHYVFKKIESPELKTAIDPIDLLSLLTRTMKDQQIDETDCNLQTPLHLAAYRGATICCLHLIKRKAVVDKKDIDGNTPLSFAVSNKHDSCAIILIQNGANVKNNVVFSPKDKPEPDKNKKPLWRWKPLVLPEVTPEKKTYSIFQEAIQKELQGVAHMVLDASGNLDSRVIEAALRVNQFNVVLRLLRKINDRSQLQILNDQQQNLFHVLALHTEPGTPGAVDSLQLKVAQMLYDKGVPLNQTDENGCTPLHYAALTHQQYDLAKFFVEKDTALDLNRKDKFDRTVIAAFFWDHHKVTKLSNLELNTKWLQLFLSKGCSLDILFDLPLPEVPVFDMLSNTLSNYFTTACEYRISPLIFAINFCEVGILRFLLENGASSNFADNRGLTPLMHAVKKNDLVMVKILLNSTYKSDGSQSKSEKTKMSRQLSRNVFAITQIDEEEEDNEDENEEEEDDAQDEQDDEDMDNEEEEEAAEDDDHDTDNVDEDEEEEDENNEDDDEISPESFPSLTSHPSKSLSQEEKKSDEEFETVEKTSDVRLNATDSQGWTAVHHLVCPLDYGTFDNEEILFVLAKVGADIQTKDNAGLSPLDHALIRGATQLARRLQILSGVENSKLEKPVFPSIEVKDSLPVPLSVDYKIDSEEYLKSIQDKDMDVDEENKCEVDRCCEYRKVGEVVMDDSQKIPYDVTLSKVDVSFGTWGMYNFYKMQVVHQKAQDLYILFTRWGRIGENGQFQHTPFQKKSEAITEFGKIFRSKTGNYWSNVKLFEKQPKKYRLVETDRSYAQPTKIDFKLQTDIPSKLPKFVQDLVKEMSSIKMMEAAINKEGFNYSLMPFGRLKRETLIEARKVLAEIGGHVKKLEKINSDYSMTQTEKNVQMQELGEKIAKLSNSYYHCIPQQNYVFDKIQPICDKDSYKTQLKHLSNLLDIECAEKIVIGAQSKMSSMNPLDYIYQAVGCKIQLLTEDCAESQYILKYIHASCKENHVHAIYKLSRPGEDTTIRSLNMENHKLLWHGSSMSNFISILHRGLLVAPPEIPMTGALFGEGLYTSDAFFKCQMYSYNANPSSNTRLALLCQVALGKTCEVDTVDDMETDLTDSDYQCKRVDGNKIPNKDFDVTLPYGAVMPLGQLQNNPKKENWRSFRMPYREFIVNDASQVCLRYLVEFSTITSRK
ncbi:poly [ADP-ribose] polymerase tankyrase-like isoform X2 [Mytilus californianus]|uniref:poly [ADP-ribose] polymerase tankyrase-like isoform X2 n=1 Tax=Mytilus californianus TaxID=6549 RepID=UPI002245C5E8|nr:poly [ADP-ribose] polymerase tankyrase-like isoform X2 [Mytilus californianus]